MHITSRDNSLLRQARAVRDGKIDTSIYVEGLRLCEEALRSQLNIEAVIYSDQLARKEKAQQVIEELSKAAKRIASVSEKLLDSISFTKTPQGIVLIADRPVASKVVVEQRVDENSLVVLLHQVNNPVNVGAILRTAEAAGVDAVITTEHTSDPLSPKSLRGAMGSAFRVQLWTGPTFDEAVSWCQSKGLATLCADASAATSHLEINWTKGSALLFGPESSGFSPEEIELAGGAVKIPMAGQVESLNVSVAAGIMLFEAARQRSIHRLH
jgi:TrmH family RNA methyltransferase